MSTISKNFRNIVGAARAMPTAGSTLVQIELFRELERLQERVNRDTPGNPAAHGFKAYSQVDEDGILQAIFERMALSQGSFVEIGCGAGVENNTHYLLLNGWRGVWIDGDPRNIRAIRQELPESQRLRVLEAMVNRENAPGLLDDAERDMLGPLDLLSVDIDGNDLEVCVACASAWKPRVIVVEYNAKFPPPAVVQIDYDPAHRWSQDDYHGASLAALVERLSPSYRLVSCNLAGTNAFFVRTEFAGAFGDHPIAKLYQPARFFLAALRSGHTPTLSYLKRSLTHPR